MAKPVDATGKRDNTAIFDPEQYGMVISPSCDALGFIQNPKHDNALSVGASGTL